MSGLDTGFQEYSIYFLIWGAVSHGVGQAGLELCIFLSQLLGCWGHIHSWPVFCSLCLGTHTVQLQIHRFEDAFL